MHANRRSVQTTLRIPWALRVAVDAARMRRARRTGELPPTLNDIVLEAIEAHLARERTGRAGAAR